MSRFADRIQTYHRPIWVIVDKFHSDVWFFTGTKRPGEGRPWSKKFDSAIQYNNRAVARRVSKQMGGSKVVRIQAAYQLIHKVRR